MFFFGDFDGEVVVRNQPLVGHHHHLRPHAMLPGFACHKAVPHLFSGRGMQHTVMGSQRGQGSKFQNDLAQLEHVETGSI